MTATAETALAPRREDLGELFSALAKAQGSMRSALKASANPFFKSKYADLASVWEACRDALSANGIAIVQFPVNDGELVGVKTILGHSSGQHLESVVWTKPAKQDPQSLGSAVTYLRRYAVAAAAGVVTEDDDGESAQGRGADPKAGKAPPAPRASTVKATGQKASAEAVKMLHTLRGKVGGLVVCDPKKPCPYENGTLCGYHKQLAAFKDPDGNPVKTSKDLSPEQIANLIMRYERKIQEQTARVDDVPDLGASLGRTANDNALEAAIKKVDVIDLQEEILSEFGVDHVRDLLDEDRPECLALVMAHAQSREAFERVREKVREKRGVVG